MSLYDLTATTLDGKPRPLSIYQGKVTLVVNTASECGFTPQYTGLEALHAELANRGLVVLGFPSNDFGGQEPGSSQEIAVFCTARYKITFPLFEKVVIRGEGQSPVYRFLTAAHGEPKWNFHKYLVGRDGAVRAAFSSRVSPNAPELRQAIDEALGAPLSPRATGG
ncbi:MAG: glutathione peroxidase [Myxococcales bacterium]|nr:glutathione peroxidase [Myxococcales bacterium]